MSAEAGLTAAANGKIAFASFRDGNQEIYVMEPDGSGQTRLTNYAGVDREPAWSPDGTKLAFERDFPEGGDRPADPGGAAGGPRR